MVDFSSATGRPSTYVTNFWCVDRRAHRSCRIAPPRCSRAPMMVARACRYALAMDCRMGGELARGRLWLG
jgi:hypothetical protein